MNINFLKLDGTAGRDPSIPAAAWTQLQNAANLFTSTFTDKYYDATSKTYKDIEINIQAGFGNAGGNFGLSTPNYLPAIVYNNAGGTYKTDDTAQLLQRLIDDRTTIDDKTAIDNLPAAIASSQTFKLTRADGKALGIIASDNASDGKMLFDVSYDNTVAGKVKFDYTHKGDSSGNLTDKFAVDFYGTAVHEISELLGRLSFVVTGGQFNSFGQALDLFKRADADKTLKFDGGVANSFSIDGGVTKLVAFNNATTPGTGTHAGFTAPDGDFADLPNPNVTPGNSGNAITKSGELGKVANYTATDMQMLDVIGYDKPATDLVLAIDTTGSMGPYIDNVKTNAIKIVNELFGPSSAPNSIDGRIGIVGFKDAAGPNGPGENTAILKFTEQNTFDARKTAAITAINGITVGGGGDIPEGDNSALLFALRDQGLSSSKPLAAGKPHEYDFSGNFRKNADHKIVLFSDAPIKDTGLAGDVTKAANTLNTTVPGPTLSSVVSDWAESMGMSVVDSSDVAYGNSGAVGNFTFAVSGRAEDGDLGGGDVEPGPIVPGSAPVTSIAAQVYVIQVGTDSSATASLAAAASDNNGAFFSGDATNLADIILKIIDIPHDMTVIGTDGDDVLDGGEGNDFIQGLAGNDILRGHGGIDFLDGGPGADTIDGGAGFDLATWLGETSGLTLNLANQALNAGSALGDTVTNVEAFYLTNFADTFVGGSTGVFVYGFDGNDKITGSSVSDIIDGGPGADTIDAGAGFDYVSYYSSATGVTLDLKNPANNTGDAKGDIITNAEAYILTSKDDTFVGTDSGQNIVFGYEGNDTLKGGFNANNWFFAGDGNDRMVGGGVQDLFVGGNGADTIVLVTPKPIAGSSVFGFTPGTDVLEISRAAFGLSAGYAVTPGSTLVSGTGPVATTTQPTFFYYTNLGLLYFDPDGTGSTAATLLAQFDTHPALTAADFHLV